MQADVTLEGHCSQGLVPAPSTHACGQEQGRGDTTKTVLSFFLFSN